MESLQIIVASTNPVKINATKSAFSLVFPSHSIEIHGYSAESGVADQPISDEETFTGAQNRMKAIQAQYPDNDYYVGIEGGIEHLSDGSQAFAWVVIGSRSNQFGKARSASFQLPPGVSSLIRQGIELGIANDQIFGLKHSKQKQGAVGILTHNLIDRQMLYERPVILALIPFLRPELYA